MRKSDGIKTEGHKAKKKKQKAATKNGTLRDSPAQVIGKKLEKNGSNQISEPKALHCDVPAGAAEKKKGKKKRKLGDDEKEVDSVPTKRSKTEEAGVKPSDNQPAKKRRGFKRLSKRRRGALKWKQRAGLLSK